MTLDKSPELVSRIHIAWKHILYLTCCCMCIDSLCCVMVVTEMVCPSRQAARCSSVGGYEGFGDDYGSGTVAPIWLDEMDCNGHESGLMDCQSGTCILLYACTVHVHGNKGFVRKVHLCVRMYIMCMHT